MTIEQIEVRLLNAVSAYDRKQATRKHYNHYALAHYMGRITEIITDIKNGADVRAAIRAGFCGQLLNVCLKSVGESSATDDEQRGPMVYTPSV